MAEKDFIIEEKTTEETKEEVKEETPLEDVVLETKGGTKSLLGATSGTDIAATSLDTKTTPAGTDNLILFNQNTNVGYQIDYDNLADAILNKITSKTYANQVGDSSAATLLAQLSTLNSNLNTAVLLNLTDVLTAADGVTFTPRCAFKCGPLVVLSFLITYANQATSIATIGTFSANYVPRQTCYGSMCCYNTETDVGVMAYLEGTYNGFLRAGHTGGKTYGVVTLIYVPRVTTA